jgi:hypothetical protein
MAPGQIEESEKLPNRKVQRHYNITTQKIVFLSVTI